MARLYVQITKIKQFNFSSRCSCFIFHKGRRIQFRTKKVVDYLELGSGIQRRSISIPLLFLGLFTLCNPTMVYAQKISEGVYYTEIDGESKDFEIISFKNNGTFTNFHGKNSSNELGKGLFTIEGNQLIMEFEDSEPSVVFDKVDTFPDLGSKVMPSIILVDKKMGTGVGGAKIYVSGEEDKAVLSDYAGIAALHPDLKAGSILKIKAKGFYTQELVYDGFFRISYYLTNDTYYKPSYGPRQYKIIRISTDTIKLSFSSDFGLLSSESQVHTLVYKKITEEKAKELLGHQQEYVNFLLR